MGWRLHSSIVCLAVSTFLSGCGGTTQPDRDGSPESGTPGAGNDGSAGADGSGATSGSDAGPPALDAAPADAGVPLDSSGEPGDSMGPAGMGLACDSSKVLVKPAPPTCPAG